MGDGNRRSSSRKRRRRHGDDARPWSDIPLDVLCYVLRRLTVRDFVHCGAVCASWRSAMLQRECRPMLEPPWVIPSPYGGSRGVVILPERRLRRVPSMPWEMIRSSEYFGSSQGWLGLQRMESVHILHALSGDVLRLPDLTTIPGVKAIPDYDGTGRWPGLAFRLQRKGGDTRRRRYALRPKMSPFFDGIFIVPSPAGGGRDQLTVLAVCSLMRRLLFARSGNVAWSFVDMPAPVGNFIYSLTGCRGSAYAVDLRGRVAAWDYSCSCRSRGATQADDDALASGPRFTRIVTLSAPSARLAARYLVEEANGDLLQVEQRIKLDAAGFHEIVGVRVFRLEQPGGGDGKGRVGWRRLRQLGDGGTAVFVGDASSAAFTCSDFPGLKKNCIYFREGVYNLRTRKMRWFHGDGIWFIPELRSPAAGLPQA